MSNWSLVEWREDKQGWNAYLRGQRFFCQCFLFSFDDVAGICAKASRENTRKRRKKTDTKRLSHGDKEMKFHAYFSVRLRTHDMLKVQCSVFKCNAIGQWWTSINRTNRRIQWHIFPYSGICTLHIVHATYWRYFLGYKIHARHHDTSENENDKEKTMRKIRFKILLFVSLVSVSHSIKSISLYSLEFSLLAYS